MIQDLPTDYQKYIHLSRYARWIDAENRRETWPETVARYCNFFKKKFGDVFPYERIYNAILNLEVMPSMRALMTAGLALERDNVPAYNCSFIAIDNPKAFDEILYILK
jgi:ribonucleoside-diphosphate reductase alpha chain